jgi:hypothetical protein
MKKRVHPLNFESLDAMDERKVEPSSSVSRVRRDIESLGAMDEVDLLVLDVEGELEALSGSMDPSSSDLPRRPQLQGGTVTQRRPSLGYNNNYQDNNNYQGNNYNNHNHHRDGREDGEEVRMSHEMIGSLDEAEEDGEGGEAALMKLLVDQQYTLMEQVVEYRRRNEALRDKLKEADGKASLMETRIDELEEENYELQANLSRLPDGSKSGETMSILPSMSSVRARGVQSKLNSDLNSRSQQLRKALLVDDGDQDGSVHLAASDLTQRKSMYQEAKSLLWQYVPFQKSLRFIQANYGSSTASYFSFLRTTMVQMLLVGLVMAFFSVIHLSRLFSSGASLRHVVTSPGLLPGFMLFSSFRTTEAFTYSSFLILTLLGLLLLLVVKLTLEHKRMVLLHEVALERKATYSKAVLSAWDFSTHTPSAIDELSSTLKTNLLQLREESRSQGRQKARSNFEAFEITTRRGIGLMLYVLLIGLSFAAIIAVTIKNSTISDSISKHSLFRPFKPLVKPICLNFINILVPQLIYGINHLEQWDSAKTEMQVLLLRVYLSNTLNTIIVAVSYLLLVDPFLFASSDPFPTTLRDAVEVPLDTSSYKCRADQAADGLFVLVAGTFVSKVRTHDENDDDDDDVIDSDSDVVVVVMMMMMMMNVVDDDECCC